MDGEYFPKKDWDTVSPADAGFDPGKLEAVREWQENRASQTQFSTFRTAIVRGGRLVAEWGRGVSRDAHLQLASATKSIFSSILGIAVHEGVIPSADEKLMDYYPEALDVPEGEGPKDGRYVYPENLGITFRQLISNTSGYMKPGEAPGMVYNYQTYGMNVLTHAVAKTYGLYSVDDPEGSPGLKTLVEDRLRIPIHGSWSYYLANFDLHAKAKIRTFGYYEGVSATVLDMARLGLLWRHFGRWDNTQLIPEDWMREATQTASVIKEHCPDDQWCYGYGFWTNDYALLWPHLPRDSFAASGAGHQHIWVCPSLDLIVAQSPGQWEDQKENDSGLLLKVCDALTS